MKSSDILTLMMTGKRYVIPGEPERLLEWIGLPHGCGVWGKEEFIFLPQVRMGSKGRSQM